VTYNNTIKLARLHSIGRNVFEDFVVPELQDIGAVAYNPVNHTVILSDLVLRKIFQYDLTTKNLTTLAEGDINYVKGLDIGMKRQIETSLDGKCDNCIKLLHSMWLLQTLWERIFIGWMR
jgi:hypothetical protein